MGGGQKEFYSVEKGVWSVGIRVLGGANWDRYGFVWSRRIVGSGVWCCERSARSGIGKGDRE